MNRTKIGSVQNPDGTPGYTWNPITGCLKGCDYCYARKLANTRLKARYLANNNLAPLIGDGPTPYHTARMIDAIDPFYPRFWPDRLAELDVLPGPDTEPPRKGIFVCDMSDLFGVGVPGGWTRHVLDVIALPANEHHRFYLLTKQPQNLLKFSPFPENCWVGITATNDMMAYNAMVHFQDIQAKLKYLYLEPLLAPLSKITLNLIASHKEYDWLIIGAQSRPYKPPEIEWVCEIVGAATKARIPVFLKDNLKPLYKRAYDMVNEPGLRQELPDGA